MEAVVTTCMVKGLLWPQDPYNYNDSVSVVLRWLLGMNIFLLLNSYYNLASLLYLIT